MGKKEIYLDNAATTRVYPAVVREIEKVLVRNYGNPSSIHAVGERAEKKVMEARKEIAREIGARAGEIVFVGSGTEADNLALKGVADASGPRKKKIVISAIEHDAVWESAAALKGYEIVVIGVDREGKLDLKRLKKEIDRETVLVSVIHANNEIGTVQDLKEIGKICRKKGVYFHTDAVQSFGKLKIDVEKMKIDLLSGSAHKIGGPKGIGFLYVRRGVKINPIMFGGGQEKGLRSGTENVAGIVGFAKALKIIKKVRKKNIERLRDRLIDGLERTGGRINGSREERLYNNVNVSFSEVEGDDVVMFLSQRGIMCSTGSACSAKNKKESRVLRAIGLKKGEVKGALRFSLNEDVSARDVDYIVKEVERVVKKLKD